VKKTILICAALLFILTPLVLPGSERAVEFARELRERGVPPLFVPGLLSLLPIFELRGGIPVGVALFGLNPAAVYGVCVLFNVVPVLPILLLLGPLRRLLSEVPPFRGFFRFLDRKVGKRRETIERYEEIGLILFVGIPLPVTGAWTGSLVAAVMGLRVLPSLLFIFLGILLAGVVVMVLTLLRIYGLLIAGALLLTFLAIYIINVKKGIRG
jgi:uncharacterized membrane protein